MNDHVLEMLKMTEWQRLLHTARLIVDQTVGVSCIIDEPNLTAVLSSIDAQNLAAVLRILSKTTAPDLQRLVDIFRADSERLDRGECVAHDLKFCDEIARDFMICHELYKYDKCDCVSLFDTNSLQLNVNGRIVRLDRTRVNGNAIMIESCQVIRDETNAVVGTIDSDDGNVIVRMNGCPVQ